MTRKLLGSIALVGLLATGLSTAVGTSVAGATKPPAVGTVGCKVTGTGKFSPKLTLAGSAGGVKFSFKLKSSDCSASATAGGVPVSITGVKVTASGFWNLPSGGPGSSCASLTADLLGTVKAKYVWTASPAIAPTTVTTSGGVPWIPSGTLFDFVLPSGATITSSTGSFAPVSSQVMNLQTNIASACAAGWGPYHTFTISGGFFNLT